ncbi:hypothetical protein, partial [Frankia gtarii]|uniref:hypothetical protein n=1 Tax=Frankia gtarii TaxID=2950102 RepID=UPI0021BF5A73
MTHRVSRQADRHQPLRQHRRQYPPGGPRTVTAGPHRTTRIKQPAVAPAFQMHHQSRLPRPSPPHSLLHDPLRESIHPPALGRRQIARPKSPHP